MKLGKMLLLGSCLLLAACSSGKPEKKEEAPPPPPPKPTVLKVETGIGPMDVPAENPITDDKVALGKMLFFDKRLGKDNKMSCETCHLPEKGWTDAKALSPKFDGKLNTRHTPTLYNVGFYKELYWDGRAATLEKQILAAWKGQMGADPDAVAMTLNGIESYKTAFQKAMGADATGDNIVNALATFVRTLRSEFNWDEYEKNAKPDDEAVAGYKIFSDADKAGCTLCHVPPNFSDGEFHNIGIGFDKEMPDMGRGKILAERTPPDPNADAMMGAFKTPTLRGITDTAPYFHDGRAKTLDEAVTLLLKGGIDNPHKDAKLKEHPLTAAERKQLMTFLKTISPTPAKFERPTLP